MNNPVSWLVTKVTDYKLKQVTTSVLSINLYSSALRRKKKKDSMRV